MSIFSVQGQVANRGKGKAMTVTEANYVWYLVGDVALIYATALALKWIGDKVWWRYVDKVLGSLTRRHRRPPRRFGARRKLNDWAVEIGRCVAKLILLPRDHDGENVR